MTLGSAWTRFLLQDSDISRQIDSSIQKEIWHKDNMTLISTELAGSETIHHVSARELTDVSHTSCVKALYSPQMS